MGRDLYSTESYSSSSEISIEYQPSRRLVQSSRRKSRSEVTVYSSSSDRSLTYSPERSRSRNKSRERSRNKSSCKSRSRSSSSRSSYSDSCSESSYREIIVPCKTVCKKVCKPKKCKPKIFEQSCPPKICVFCEGKEARIVVFTNNARSIQWQVSTDGGCTFDDIPSAIGPIFCFTPDKHDDGNLYRPVITTCLPECEEDWVDCQVKCLEDPKKEKGCPGKGGCQKKKCINPCKQCGPLKPTPWKRDKYDPWKGSKHDSFHKNPCEFNDPCKDCHTWRPVNKKCKKWEVKAIFICQSVKVIIIPKPKIIKPPKDQFVNSGCPAIFEVKAKPKDDVQYIWRLNGVIIRNADSSKLIIPSATTEDEGIYSVTVKNDCGQATSEAILSIKNGDGWDCELPEDVE